MIKSGSGYASFLSSHGLYLECNYHPIISANSLIHLIGRVWLRTEVLESDWLESWFHYLLVINPSIMTVS